MSGIAGDNRSSYPEETPDPSTPALHNRSFVDHTKESASSVADKIAAAMQPGDTKSTTRRLSDTPTGMRTEEWQASFGDRKEEGQKTMLQSAQETVAKALGGGSRGAS